MKILVIDDVHPVLFEKFSQAGIAYAHEPSMDSETVLNAVQDFDGIIIRSKIIIDKTFIDQAPNLKIIGRVGAGMETIDVAYAQQQGIACFNSPEGNRDAVAEHALGMLLSIANKLHTADAQVRNGIWMREENRGFELKGKTIGIVGFGNMGQAFAQRLAGFSVKIIAYDKYKKGFSSPVVDEVSLEQLQSQSDVISFHIPQTAESIYLCDDQFLSRCQNQPIIINTARGKVVKLSALADALRDGKIRGACLDVLEYENYKFENFLSESMPESWQYLTQQPNIIFSPHVAGWTIESKMKLSAVLADKIIKVMGNI